ncbi:hypothetical protein [Thermomonospora catenispora]|uniref:hypothetical protein n=1 Tax=Thermomonospora catenispora TaxID=2493090 RepID=UPI0011243CF6|nr:hypothetical protein [Thermomonospora catenispora]TNY37948.1 hypothetical protein EIO00_05040 [Thermomonospora catenispora]
METSRLTLCAVTLTATLALTACGGSGGSSPGLRLMSPLQHCMAENGVQVPENVRPADLENSDDPKIVRALRRCRDLLPRDTAEPTAFPS